jgi:hypothetical protein
MTRDGDGKPAVEDSAKGLGVRPNDIAPDAAGLVSPGTGGLSVAPRWRDLPSHRVPERLRDKMPKAKGSNAMACFVFGDGRFADGPLAEGLALRVDKPTHGVAEPSRKMSAGDYRSALAATRDGWTIDEE